MIRVRFLPPFLCIQFLRFMVVVFVLAFFFRRVSDRDLTLDFLGASRKTPRAAEGKREKLVSSRRGSQPALVFGPSLL